jgi:Predicted transcription factor, homolog of eukaryotic MBF1
MIKGDMTMRNEEKTDIMAFGQAVKEAREKRGWTRERLATEIDLAPRYILALEHEGQHPSVQVLYNLANLFDISIDQYFFPARKIVKSTSRRQLEAALDELDDNDYIIVQATVDGIIKAKNQ